MKISLITLLLLLSITTCFSQDPKFDIISSYNSPGNSIKPPKGNSQNLIYDVHGLYTRPVKKEKLNVARTLNQISPGFPTNWISEYVSAEIVGTCSGKSMKAISYNENLTTEQRKILNTVDLGSDIEININYKSKNSATDKIEIRTINFSVTVVPETEAEFPGGQQQLRKYLKENAIINISEEVANELKEGTVKFTINENGEIINTQLSVSTGNSGTDKMMLDVINKMPKWNPAENSKGTKVKQVFVFTVGSSGC